MNRKEFTENVANILNQCVYYHDNGDFESPQRVVQMSPDAVMVEFFDPQDTFILTIEHRKAT